MEIDEKKNNENLITNTSNNSIIINDNCIPDENEIKSELILYNQEIYENKEINFDEIMKNHIGIASLILSKKNNITLESMNNIINLIKLIDKYKNFSNEKIFEDLKNYYKTLIEKDKKKKEIINVKKEKRENVFNRLYSKRKKFRIKIKSLRKNKSYSIDNVEIFEKLYLNDSYNEKKIPNSNNNKIKNEVNINYKSKKILYNKYKSEFEKSLDELFKENKINNIEKLNYNEFILFTKKLGFLKKEENEIEINLIKNIYDCLTVNKKENKISMKLFFKFSLLILNLNWDTKKDNIKNNNDNHKRRSFSSTSSSSRTPLNKLNNHLKINTINNDYKQSKKIYNDYKILKYNYYNYNQFKENDNYNNYNNNIINNNLTFKPVLNNKFNSKIKGNLFSHISKFQNMKKINNNKLKKEQLKIETQECTFKPQLTNYIFKRVKNKKENINNEDKKVNLSINNNIKEFKSDLNLTRNYYEKKNNISYKKIRENTFNNNSNIRNKSLNISNKKDLKRIKTNCLIKNKIPKNNIKKAILSLNNNLSNYNIKVVKEEKEKNKINKSRNKNNENSTIDNFKKQINKSYNKVIKKEKNEKKLRRNISYSNSKNKKMNNSLINKENNLLNNKPLFILDINLTNRSKKLYIYKGINIDKTIEEFIKENKINDSKNVEFIKDLIQIELNKFK